VTVASRANHDSSQTAAQLDRVRADLRWLAGAPPLCSVEAWAARGCRAATPPRAGDIDEAALGELASAPPRRLGRYFERLHQLALSGDPAIELLAQNRVVMEGKRTAGELDVLYRCRGEVIHRELAVKLYVGLHDSADPVDWIGPDRVDRLDLKLRRLTKQLGLPRRALAEGYWPDDLPLPTRSEVLLLGALFVHPDAVTLPRAVAAKTTLGFWCEANQLGARFPEIERWAVLLKPWWLAPEQTRFEAGHRATVIADRVSELHRPLLIGAASACEPPRRGFVVPNGWFRDLVQPMM
jgi:hypothetical protein